MGRWIAEIDAEGDPDNDGGFGLIPQDGNFVMGINQLLFHKGYMIAPLARNAAARGTETRRGAMASFDISDLSDIKRTFFRQDDMTNEIREAHGLVISSGDILCINTILGVQFWDVSDPTDMTLISDLRIPEMSTGTYGKTGWWVMGQHPYYYLGSTQRGLHIIDASDPATPVVVKRISGTDVGIPSIGSVHCIGNLMVLGSAGQSEGTSGPFATLDISDPVNPRLLDRKAGSGNYSVGVYGHYITTHGAGGLKVWDMSNPSAVQEVYHNPGLDIALYSCFADEFFHVPNFWTYEKHSFPFPGEPLLVSSDVTNLRKTHEFTEKLGNLIVATGGGEGEGAKFIPHEAAPDTRPPEVNFVSPADLATNQSLTSRIGVIVTDTLDFETVNSSTFMVREIGGLPVAGDFSYSRNYLNFIPLEPLKTDATYEVILTADGITDIVGNGMVEFRSVFSTGAEVDLSEPLRISNNPAFEPRIASSEPVSLAAQITGGTGEIEYRWDVTGADGVTIQTPWSTSDLLVRAFPEAGNHFLVLRVRDDRREQSKLLRLIVHRPLPSGKPAASSGIALSAPGADTVWNVNPDNDSVTVLNAQTLARIAEIPVASDPRSLAMVGADEVWVASHDVPSVSVLSRANPGVISQIPLPRGSAPEGMLVDHQGAYAYVALRGSAGVAKVNVATRQLETVLKVLPWPKGLALDQSGQNLYVTHFISPDDAGKVTRIDLGTFTVGSVVNLAISTEPDTISSGRGLPNYLGHPGISPDGKSLLVPSKQDNILRGLARDGQPLTSENSVRAIVSRIDLDTAAEDHESRWDLNDSDSPNAVAFSPLGNVAFVSIQGTNSIMVLDAYNRAEISRFPVGAAPDALVLNPDTGILYVHQFLDRQVSAYDVSSIASLVHQEPVVLAETSVVANEKLPANVLTGKKIFYDAGDSRMSSNGYISCASCHLDGDTDGRVWDFTDRGEGLRNTTDLRGRSGTGHGPLHWSANFDEIQDFENDIRLHFGGLGFMPDASFETTSDPLGQPKAGISPELDALAAYVTSLRTVPESPERNSDGSLTADAVYGREIFARLNCVTCHSDASYTDSASIARHDVGTLKPASGASLTGIDTPTLRGVWASAPFFHDGSAPTLEDVIETSGPLHGNMAALTPMEKQQLAAYLYQLESGDIHPGGAANSRNLSGYVNWRQENFSSTSSPIGAPGNIIAGDGVSNLLKYFAAEAPDRPGLGPVRGSRILSGIPSAGDPRYLQLTVRMRKDSQNLRYVVETATDFSDWESESVEPVLLDGSAPDYNLMGLRVPLSNRPAVFMRLGVEE